MRHRFRIHATALVLAAGLIASLAGLAAAAPEAVSGGIRFTYADANARSVAWAGLFNNWNTSASPLTKGGDGVWTIVLALPPGEHEYKFVVDGSWVADPENPATRGDYGNSLVSVGADGKLKAVAATSNTAFNPKILMGGRGIATYSLVRNPLAKRYELQTPSFDFGLKFDIRVSDLMSAKLIMNTTNTNGYNSTLDLERGSIEFNGKNLQVVAFDNAALETWDDPLHLVGNVGIYNYRFGYDRQGFLFHTVRRGFDAQMLYADNFETGGNSYPTWSLDDATVLRALLSDVPVTRVGSTWTPTPGAAAYATRTNTGDGNENTFALRVRRELPGGLRLGVLARNDRGFDLSEVLTGRITSPGKGRVTRMKSDQEWWGGGFEAAWQGPRRTSFTGELLTGVKRLNGLQSLDSREYAVTADSTGVVLGSAPYTPVADPEPEDHDLDRSTRFHLGGEWVESHGDIRLRASIEGESHDYRFIDEGLDNSTTTFRFGWDRNWRYYLNREVLTGLAIERQTFDYNAATPWAKQLWYPEGNFWLEHGEHVVSFDRMVMLGGGDVVSVKPSVEIPIRARRDVRLRWDGTFNTPKLDKRPKFSESIFRLGLDVFPDVRLSTDVRWVKYDDPVLQLYHGYQCSFTQLSYRVSPDIHVAVGFGVDPEVSYRMGVDENPRVARDLFLFGSGATAAEAQSNFYGLGPRIEAAEKALRDVRAIQVKGTVNF